MTTVRVSNDDMASSSFVQHFSSQGLPSIVVEDADLHSSRPGVFSPPPKPARPNVRPAVAIAETRQRQGVHSEDEDEGSEDEYGEEEVKNAEPMASNYNAKRLSRSISQDDLAHSPLTSTPPFRARTGSASRAGIKHGRSRSHFSIPDVMVTASEEDGSEVHFELQLKQQDRRMELPTSIGMGLTGVHSFPSLSSMSSNTSGSSSTTSIGSPTAVMSPKKVRKHTPSAIRIVNAECQDVPSTAPLPSDRVNAAERTIDAPVTTSTTSTSKIGQRLRKSSLPSLFSKRERDAARMAATNALPPSPTLPQYAVEQQARRPSEPMAMRSRTESLGDALTRSEAPSDESSSAESRPNTQRNASLPFQSSSGGTVSSTTFSDTSPASPISPTESSRSFSPLSSFFANSKKDAMADDGRMVGSPTPSSLIKKEMKQRQKEEKALMKELEKVDRMVRKHDEKARKAAKKGGKGATPNAAPIEAAPVVVAALPPAAEEPVGRTKKALRRMTMFRANTGATPRIAVPTRKPSVKQRTEVQSCTSMQQQAVPVSILRSNTDEQSNCHAMPASESDATRVSLLRDVTNDIASMEREWADLPSPVGSVLAPKDDAASAMAVNASEIVAVTESATRRNSVRRAISARRRMSAAAGRAVRPRSSDQGDDAPPLPHSSGNKVSKDKSATDPTVATATSAPAPSFARPAQPLLNAEQRAAKSRYRIESIVVDGSHLGWEEELGLSWRDESTPGGSGQATPRALASEGERRAPLQSLYDDSKAGASSSTSSPPALSLSMFESLYKEVEAMELSFGEKYPVEAKVRRKSMSSETRRHSSISTAIGMDGIDLKDAPPSPSLPTDYQFTTAMEAATNRSSRVAKQSDGSGASYSDTQRSVRERTTSASSSATSSASSSAIPATPPLPTGFTAFKNEAVADVAAVPTQWSGDAAASPVPPSSSQSKQPSVLAAGRRIRVGANPRGFKFPPPVPVASAIVKIEDGAAAHARAESLPLLSSSNEASDAVDTAIGQASSPRSNSTPLAL